MNRKVRVNSIYRYEPVLIDRLHAPFGNPQPGQLVRVVNKYGCPPANTMGHCYITDAENGEFLGLVCTNSLQSRKEAENR